MDKDLNLVFMDALMYSMAGEDSSKAILNQEARGQRELVRNQRLPIMMNNTSGIPDEVKMKDIPPTLNDWSIKIDLINKNIKDYTRLCYERLGIKIIREYDDIFYDVELPDGWEIKSTDHSMWNNLYDDKGRKRASIFYKAAFYDRDAFINLNTRYYKTVTHVSDSKDYKIWSESNIAGFIKDSNDNVVYQTEEHRNTGNYDLDQEVRKVLDRKLDVYLATFYPEYTDIYAYWD